jgi:hypothetical protein
MNPTAMIVEPHQLIPTGISFLDGPMQGGQLQKGLHGFLGPIGGGKTTLAAMLAVEGAWAQYRNRDLTSPPGCWVLATIGESANHILHRVISYGAKIHRQVIEAANRLQDFTTSYGLRDYERRRVDELVNVDGSDRGELGRYEAFKRVQNGYFSHLDLDSQTGFDRTKGPVGDVRNHVAELNSVGRPIAGVVIDYLGVAVRRFVMQNDIPPKLISHHLQQFVRDCRELIAEPFGCPVWVFHQLAGAANGRGAAYCLTHDDAMECRHLGEHLDTCLVIGNRDKVSGCLVLRCTKLTLPGIDQAPPSVLLEFDPDFASLRESTTFRFCPSSGKIVRIGESRVRVVNDETMSVLRRLAKS